MVSGKIGVGKDMVGKYLNTRYGYHLYAFATKLKEGLEKLGWNNIKDDKGRVLLQTVGQAFREYDQDHWVKLLAKKITEDCKNASDKEYNCCITDCRFKNEIELLPEYIKDFWNYKIGKVIRIRIEGINYSSRSDSNDISETELDNYDRFDYVIDNIGKSKEDVCRDIDKIIEKEFIKDLG